MKIGIIGCGTRMCGVLNLIRKFELGAELVAVADIDISSVKEKLNKIEINTEDINFYEDAQKMLDTEDLDGIMVGTRCSLHPEMAVKVLNKNYPLFLEKPVATDLAGLTAIKNAYEASKSEVLVSFPLRVAPMAKLAKEIIDSGVIGTIEHVQTVNNVPYGTVYYQSWYRDEQETGGLFLQKATHDLDYINYLVGEKPVKICAMKSKQIFKGNHLAGLKCTDCAESEDCPESPFYKKFKSYGNSFGDGCAFAVDTGNEDSGSAIIRYESGMHANYSQNFFARNEAASRGARLLGYKGTLQFDWYTNELKVFLHHTPRTDTYKFDTEKMAHFGGDTVLAYNFIQMMREKEKAVARMEDGLLSALMCIKATESANNEEFRTISWE